MSDEISSIQTMLSLLKRDRVKLIGDLWYRGHSDYSWELVPSFFRLTSPPSELTLLKKFKQSASLLLDQKPTTSYDWLFYMQHFGVPTRLLDWSESVLTALYFSVEDPTYDSCDSALYVLSPVQLNENSRINSDEANYIPSFDEDILENYSVEKISSERNSKLDPIAAIASRNNPRIQAQQGVFTINHRIGTPIDSIGDKLHYLKYRIPASAKPELKEDLRLLGVTKFQLFPELSSIGDNIKGGLV